MQREQAEVAVIGAGAIGLAIAHRLASEGRDVVLIDPEKPGSGASYGNAGTIANYAVQPVGTPGVLRALPSLLFDRNSPLSIRHAALPSLAPWLMRFARQSLPATARRNALALVDLMAGALPGWQDLAGEIGGADLMQHRGCLYLYETAAAMQAAQPDLAFRREHGIEVEMLDTAGLAALEPGLPEMAGAAWFSQAVFLSDPGRMMDLLAAGTLARGARLINGRAVTLARDASGVLVGGPGLQVRARRVVIAAGAHSRALARAAGDKVPLDTERGYHLEWDMESPRLTRPSCPTERGFYLCPMEGRLRVAGTVELGGLTAPPPSPHRIARLLEGARAIYPDLGPPDRTWLGFRPSMPDSLPVIGPGREGDVIHAYGHGHVGLTLAPVTADLVADLVAGRKPGSVITPCLPSRF